MKYLLPILLLFIIGCENPIKYGPEQFERAQIVDMCYVPPGHGSDVSVGMTFDGDGNLSPTITPISIDIPARYAVVFKCQHGKFIIQGDERAKNIYESFDEGDNVTVKYCEKIRFIDSKQTVIGLHFLGCVKVEDGQGELSK
jgi:hypothetical protein